MKITITLDGCTSEELEDRLSEIDFIIFDRNLRTYSHWGIPGYIISFEEKDKHKIIDILSDIRNIDFYLSK